MGREGIGQFYRPTLSRPPLVSLAAPGLRASDIGVVIGHRLARAFAGDVDARCRHAAAGEVVAHAVGALDRQRVVDGVAAGAVGVANNAHAHRRIEPLRELVEHRPHLRLDVGAADVE
jgi:hypothetical protein